MASETPIRIIFCPSVSRRDCKKSQGERIHGRRRSTNNEECSTVVVLQFETRQEFTRGNTRIGECESQAFYFYDHFLNTVCGIGSPELHQRYNPRQTRMY